MYLVFLTALPFECVLTLRPEEVDVVLELQLEDEVLVDAVLVARPEHRVAEQGEARQGEVVLRKIMFSCHGIAL